MNINKYHDNIQYFGPSAEREFEKKNEKEHSWLETCKKEHKILKGQRCSLSVLQVPIRIYKCQVLGALQKIHAF